MTSHNRGETPHTPDSLDGRARIVIEGVQPEVDCGLFPIKRTVGEKVVVEADIFADGHDVLDCRLLHGPLGPDEKLQAPLTALLVLAALQSMPENLHRAARIDGAGPIERFFKITLPWLRPMLLLILLLTSINSIMAFDLFWIMTKGGPGSATTVFRTGASRTRGSGPTIGRSTSGRSNRDEPQPWPWIATTSTPLSA